MTGREAWLCRREPLARAGASSSHVGTAALGCPVEQSSTDLAATGNSGARSAGQPWAAIPTQFGALPHERGARAHIAVLMLALKAVGAAVLERKCLRHLQKSAGRVGQAGSLAIDQSQFPVQTKLANPN